MAKIAIDNKVLHDIIEDCKRGNSLGQEMLFRLYASRILTTCRRYEMVDYGAEDILQDTFITVFDKIQQFDPEKGNIEAWIRKIAVNKALKYIRKRKINVSSIGVEEYNIADTQGDDDLSIIAEHNQKKILNAIKKLPTGYRTVFNMYLLEGYTHDEIANHLDISTSTSMSQLSKAKKMLRKLLSQKGDENIKRINFL